MKKRILALVLCVTLALAMVLPMACPAQAAEKKYNDYLYYYIEDDIAMITYCDNTYTGVADIPSTIEGYPVVYIYPSAFKNCAISGVKIPDSVQIIGSYAFSHCSNLTEVTIPDSVVYIEGYAFEYCPVLSRVTLPEGLLVMGNYVFRYCKVLSEITVPASVLRLESTFTDATSLKTIRFMGHIPVIIGSIFQRVRATVYYPSNSATWNENTKADYGGTIKWVGFQTEEPLEPYLRAGSFDDTTLWTLSEDGTLTLYGEGAYTTPYPNDDWRLFERQIRHVVVSEGITSLEGNTFYNMRYIESASLPDSLESIYVSVFMGCQKLKSITIPENTTTIEGYSFGYCYELRHVYFTGDAPKNLHLVFTQPTTIYYPANNPTWKDTVSQTYNTSLTWVPYIPIKGQHVRLFGTTRYDTAFKTADELKSVLKVDKFQNIIVACGTNFPDALAGTYLASQKSAPILLTSGNNIGALNRYIRENLADRGTVYLLGGEAAVPGAIGKGIEGATVKRLGGADRYETNLNILKEAGVEGKDIIVCTGLNFADSLSASATGLPILLVKGSLTNAQKDFLSTTSGKKIIVGGTSAVNASIEKQLAAYGSVKRLAGKNRYATSVLVAQEFFPEPASAVLAYALNFPDGLCGGPLAYALRAPLLLTAPDKEAAAAAYTTQSGIKIGYILGGPGLISDQIVRRVFAMGAYDQILVR